MIENTSLWCSCLAVSTVTCMTCSMKACFTLYWSTSLHFLLFCRLHTHNFVSSCSLISFPNVLWFSPPSLLFLSLTFLALWVKLHDCFTVMPQFECCRASLRRQSIGCMVHLGSVWANLPLKEPLRMVILPSEKNVSHWEHVGLALSRLKWFVMVIHVERPHEDLHYRSFVCKIKGVKSAPYVRYMLWTWSCLAYNRPWAPLLMESKCSANPCGGTGNLHEIFWFL